MKRREGLDPILLEMIVVTLVFAISAAVIVQLLGAAAGWSGQSRKKSDALAALSAMTEELMADDAALAAGGRQERLENGALLSAEITPQKREGGVYYALFLQASIDGETALAWRAGRFVSDSGVTP